MNRAQLALAFHVMSTILIFVSAQNTTTITVKVGVVLDMETWVGTMGLSCMEMALSDFYASHTLYNTRLLLHTRNSNRDVVRAAAVALELIKNVEVQAIIGPVNSMQANFIIDLGEKAQVPIISFSATSPSLTSVRSPYFFRAALNSSSQLQAISSIVQSFGWREVVPIYVDNEFGQGIISYLIDALQTVDAHVPYRSVIPQSASNDRINTELYKLMTMQTRVFVVHMNPNLASRLFMKAKEIGMMEQGYVWIVTDAITDFLGNMHHLAIEAMQGVLGVETYVPETLEVDDFTIRWKRKFREVNSSVDNPQLDVYGLWAYDAVWALALAVEKAGTKNLVYEKPNQNVSRNLTDLETFGINRNGPKLRDKLSNVRFKGLAGEFALNNGKLQSSKFQIVNVIGNGGRGIGIWTPQTGLTKSLNSTRNISEDPTVIWPGDTTSVPKGWEIPTNGKRLRIGVPLKDGFSEFVYVKRDSSTNTIQVDGYCIEIFNAVLNALPYVVTPDFIPFENPNGQSAGTYNDLVYQVKLGKFDAVVGDITIVTNRSLYVDFTLPYTESGVSMVVPFKNNSKKNAWVFLKPLTWDLWVTSGCFFVFIGFVVWLLEHRINEDFRGPLSHQIGTSLWFSFSTMVFAHRETIVSNLSRFVVVMWFFVVLILTQSYTASLTSLLTVQQLQPTITDVEQLLKNKERVGYQEGSFVYNTLKSMKFEDSNLVTFGSPGEMHKLFQKGSANGGIVAAFDEIPYIKVFLSRYCKQYTMRDPTFKTDGFGFAFPRGSPLVADISRAILNVTEGEEMNYIEKKWFGGLANCPSSTTTEVTSTSLSLDSFWGLFLIVGIASVLALLICVAMFIYKERYFIKHFDSDGSILRKIGGMLRMFDQKDLTSHTFRRSTHFHDQNGSAGVHGCSHVGPVEASPSTNYPPSPSNYSPRSDSDFIRFRERGGTEYNDDPSCWGGASPEHMVPVIELVETNQGTEPRIEEMSHLSN